MSVALARALAFRATRALPGSSDALWTVLGPEGDWRERTKPWTLCWRSTDWRAAIHGLLGCAPTTVRPLDLAVAPSVTVVDEVQPLIAPGRHLLVPGTVAELIGESKARRRARWRPHTILAVDGQAAVGWWTRGRSARGPRLILVDVPDASD